MRAAGCDAPGAIQLMGQVEGTVARGLPLVLVSDGEDVVCIFGEPGDNVADVVRAATRMIPALAS